jgi:outer membrane protein OmpA-like peptidoglycan-associated protein
LRALYTSLLYCLLIGVCSAQTFKDSLLVLDRLDVYFENDSFSLDITTIKSITDLSNRNKNIKGAIYTLEGHTNSIGDVEYNQILSDNRVNAAKNLLLNGGLAINTIKLASWGKTKPEYPDDEKGKILNRQVKITVNKAVKLRKIIGQLSPKGAIKKGVVVEFNSKLFHTKAVTDDQGNFEVYLPDKLPISVSAKQPGFINDYLEIIPNEKTNPLLIKMMELKEGASIYITSLNFFGDKNILIETSKASLQHLTEQIIENDKFCFEIQGHVNAPHLRPEDISQYLRDLSIARAGFVYEHFKESGVKVERMIANGYGNTHMLYPKPKNDEQHLFNRRVELKIISCKEINTLREKFDEMFFIDMANKKVFK